MPGDTHVEPPRPPFPWWLVGLLGGGLAFVLLVVVSFFLRGNPLPGLGALCAQQEPRCGEGLICTEDNLCLGAGGFACSREEQCATRRCMDGRCQ
ncbi:hypothetical protein [Archangium sp.]|jgi:hypothetical protein|uniref:hypothetical protein n=1 Tax=Archangium sp. TaxID=1872627 RepID=UPI002ED7A939